MGVLVSWGSAGLVGLSGWVAPENGTFGRMADAVIGKKIDIVVPHSGASASIRFGTILDEHACDESFGVDDVALYVH